MYAICNDFFLCYYSIFIKKGMEKTFEFTIFID